MVWVVVAAVAVSIGVFAVTQVGAALTERGPVGNPAARNDLPEGSASPNPDAPLVTRTFTEEFGEIDVACRGAYALGLAARPDRTKGWRTISFEEGPDDDIDAVFAQRGRSLEIEVFCNLGTPTIGEVESNTLSDQE